MKLVDRLADWYIDHDAGTYAECYWLAESDIRYRYQRRFGRVNWWLRVIR